MKKLTLKDKTKEIISYGFWGCMTVLFSFVSYAILKIFIDNYKIANFISIIMTKLFAYVVNKKFVFKTKAALLDEIKEFFRFLLARGFTGVVDFLGQIALVELLGIDDFISKALMIVITTILNYFLCSIGVFKKENKVDTKHS